MMSLLLAVIALPLLASLIISRLDNQPNWREAVSLFTAVTVLTLLIGLYQQQPTASATLELFSFFPGLTLAFSIQSFGLLFAFVASSLWLVTLIYAIGYMRGHHEKHQTRFYGFFAIAISATLALAFSDNLFTLFICYEILTLSTYPLVTHHGTDKAKQRGRRYLMILMGSSIALFLPAIIVLWHYIGDLTFVSGGYGREKLPANVGLWLYLLCLLGIAKAAVMPMHKWLPAAMVAPTPVSALLHAVAVVKAGVFSLFKVTYFIFGADYLAETSATGYLIWLPAMSILLASFIAISKDNLKERLAYSTVSQLSYIVLGIMLVNQAGILASSLHIVMHAFAKIVLFFAAGAILVATHKTQISQMAGLGKQMPITFICFFLASLSIIGLPPLGGLWSKWYLIEGSLSFAYQPWVLVGVLLLSSLLNIWYLLSIPVQAFMGKAPAPRADEQIHRVAEEVPHSRFEAPFACLLGILIPTLICLYLFFFPYPFFSLIQMGSTGLGG